MQTDTPTVQEGAGSTGADEAPADPAVSGPHAATDRYGRLDHHYWRCERCGLESTDGALRDGCWRCAGRDGEDGGA